MTRIIESLSGPGHTTTAARARNTLVTEGAQFVEAALADEPDGPVEMVTTLSRTDVVYEVVIGDIRAGDHGRARTIWHRSVAFGATDRTVAGGHDFVQAARAQERVAWAALELLEASR